MTNMEAYLQAFLSALALIIAQWAGADATMCKYQQKDEQALITCYIQKPAFKLLPINKPKPQDKYKW